ncbi:hypothetical protein KAJ89_03095 [Candidatus Parcubacteria bacterium]|nr:hypothetical protein [Candidatus Parcubacteria bacterium]
MQNQLKKAINIARKTGDRLIVYDLSRGDSAFVVMSLDEYEKLVTEKSEVRGLTEDELLDKINRDIAIWKSEQDMELSLSKKEIPNVFETVRDRKFTPISDVLDETDFITDEMDNNKEKYFEEKFEEKEELSTSNHWRIPRDRKEGAEEIIEEDTQYLETV